MEPGAHNTGLHNLDMEMGYSLVQNMEIQVEFHHPPKRAWIGRYDSHADHKPFAVQP